MFRNKIINGGCLIAQRGSISSVNNTVTYGGADRFFVAPFFTTSTGTISKSTLTSSPTGFGQFLTISSTGTGNIIFAQRIESSNIVDLNNKTVTFSGIIYQNTGSTVTTTLSVKKANAVDNFSGTTLIGAAGSISLASGVETPFTYTVTLGSSDATTGLAVEINFTGLGALTSKVFAIGAFQLETGSVATPFEQRPIGMELALCQRYYEFGKASYATTTTTGTSYGIPIVFKIQKRAIPIVSTTQINSNIGSTGQADVLINEYSYSYFLTSGATGTGQLQISYTANSEL
jgi:hypothetical protein